MTPFDPDAIMKSLPEGNEGDNNSDGMEAKVNGAVSEEAERSSSQVPRSIVILAIVTAPQFSSEKV